MMIQMKRTARRCCRCAATIIAAACASPLVAQACPPQGDAKQPLAKELNPYKNRDEAPPVAKINPVATLNTVLLPGNDLHRWSRDEGAIFEGIVVAVKPGGIESVDCHAKDLPHRDTHLELALDRSAPANQRVIVEVTPRWRQNMAVIADWSTPALRKRLLGRRVRITGWLFDDLEHQNAAENSNPGEAGNWRATVWEIHPITGIQVLSAEAVVSTAAAPTTNALPHQRARSRKTCFSSNRGKSCHRRHRTHRHAKPS